MRSTIRNTGMVCVLIGLLAGSALGQVPTFTFQAVEINGTVLDPPATYVEVDPGDIITVHFMIRDWSPTGLGLRGFQVALDADAYYSGTTGNVLPRNYAATSAVGQPNWDNAYIDTLHPDFIFLNESAFVTSASNSPYYWYTGAVMVGGIPCGVDCTPAYLGTVILQASEDANGTFTIKHDEFDEIEDLPGPDRNYINNENDEFIWPYDVEPLVIQVGGAADVAVVGSEPAMDETLWRTANNYMTVDFDGPVPAISDGDVMIQELIAGGTYGPNMAANFTLTPDGNTLNVAENGSVLTARTWYAVRATGWAGVEDFMIHVLLLPGDANNDGRVLPNDLSLINTMVPSFSVPLNSRMDINGDTRVLPNDLSVANSFIPDFGVAKPAGH